MKIHTAKCLKDFMKDIDGGIYTTYSKLSEMIIDQDPSDRNNLICIDKKINNFVRKIEVRTSVSVEGAEVTVDNYHDTASVIAYRDSRVHAKKNAIIRAYRGSFIIAEENASIHAYDECEIRTDIPIARRSNSVVIHRVSTRPQIITFGNTKVVFCDENCARYDEV
jgi:hypothetical protein